MSSAWENRLAMDRLKEVVADIERTRGKLQGNMRLDLEDDPTHLWPRLEQLKRERDDIFKSIVDRHEDGLPERGWYVPTLMERQKTGQWATVKLSPRPCQ